MDKIYSSKELRKLADKLIKASPEEFRTQAVQDIQTVISELHINRTQLQSQNEELQQLNVQLQDEKQSYVNFFDTSPVGLIITDKHGLIQKVNNKTCDLFEYEKDHLVATSIYDYCKDENDKDELFEKIRRAVKGSGTQSTFIRFKRSKSLVFNIQVMIVFIPEENQEGQIQITLTDTSAVNELKQQLQQSSKMEAIGNLAGGIAHDFNNMLSVIIGNTELALEDTPNYNTVYENLQEIQKASQRAQDVVKQLLTFAQKSNVKYESVQLGKVVDSSLKMFRPVIPTSIKIDANLNKNDYFVMADATQIHQIVINLLTNAMDAMPNKIGTIKVELTKEHITKTMRVFSGKIKKGKYVNLVIKDSGHGIEPALLPRIFDPYFSTKDNIKNSGLGLSVVLGIVETLGGGIQIDSDPSIGTTFQIYLPLTEKAPLAKTVSPTKVQTGSGKILFIDDEVTITKFGSRLIERMGYSVETANDPIIAVEKFRSDPDKYDLVITDMTMPNMTGDILVQEIKSMRSNLPVIICTGYHENMDKKKAKFLGAKFAMKPLNREELAQLIHEALTN